MPGARLDRERLSWWPWVSLRLAECSRAAFDIVGLAIWDHRCLAGLIRAAASMGRRLCAPLAGALCWLVRAPLSRPQASGKPVSFLAIRLSLLAIRLSIKRL